MPAAKIIQHEQRSGGNQSDRIHNGCIMPAMKPRYPHPMNEHHLARSIAWAMAVFVWLIAGMPNHTSAGKRHHKRYARVRIAQLRAFVRNVVLIRAAQLVKPLPLHRFPQLRARRLSPRPRMPDVAPHRRRLAAAAAEL
jgi:hypothetical protein